MKQFTLLLILVFTLSTGCSLFESENESEEQEFLFETHSANWAWGFYHGGSYIDNKGNIYSFKYDSLQQYKLHEKETCYEHELRAKYENNKKFKYKIGLDVINSKTKLIKPAIKGSYSDAVNGSADMGQTRYICFILENGIYRKILLRTEGDINYGIETPEADSLVKWLKTIKSN